MTVALTFRTSFVPGLKTHMCVHFMLSRVSPASTADLQIRSRLFYFKSGTIGFQGLLFQQ